ncbi:MAG: Nramp family divalent metal transporter [Flavobacteriaceae bacterium]|nr:Nramp family divalent metal transporter [Flavobacteriaceae bacterium]
MKNPLKNLGPGTLVAAAFIGPGTVTVCTLAGVDYGFTLLWAMGLSIIATIILQEMAARLGIVTGKGLAEIVRIQIKIPFLRIIAIFLILSAILIGNAAYEAGNISGGVLGVQTISTETSAVIGGLTINVASLAIGMLAFILLYFGNYKVIEKSLVALVIFMSLSFLVAAVLTMPNISEIVEGIFIPRMPEEGILTVIALVGTTVVPYNLFLHASIVKEKWKGETHLKTARNDTVVSIVLGGLVSMAIIICAAALKLETISSASDLALGLEPLYGSFSKYIFGLGLFAAGITSAITAPLAAAYVVNECLGWESNFKSVRFRIVWGIVLFLGIIFSSVGIKPIEIIKFAQVSNGLLLPIIALFLLWAVNNKRLLGKWSNRNWQNLMGIVIVIATIVLSVRSLDKVFQFDLF